MNEKSKTGRGLGVTPAPHGTWGNFVQSMLVTLQRVSPVPCMTESMSPPITFGTASEIVVDPISSTIAPPISSLSGRASSIRRRAWSVRAKAEICAGAVGAKAGPGVQGQSVGKGGRSPKTRWV